MSERNRFTEHGQIDGGAVKWYERKGRIYIDDGHNDGAVVRDYLGVKRIVKKTGRVAERGDTFPRSELTEIAPLSTRGLGSHPQGLGDAPEPIK